MTTRVDDALEIGRLAALPPLEYERERELAAKKLGVRPRVLDKQVSEARTRAGLGNGHHPEGIPGGLPVIRVNHGERHLAATGGAAAVRDAGCEIYVRGARLVRIAMLVGKTATGEELRVPGMLPVTHAALARVLGGSALWEKTNWKGEIVRIDPPIELAEQETAIGFKVIPARPQLHAALLDHTPEEKQTPREAAQHAPSKPLTTGAVSMTSSDRIRLHQSSPRWRDRLARSTFDLFAIVKQIVDAKAQFRSLAVRPERCNRDLVG
jgi:hypothetical protein